MALGVAATWSGGVEPAARTKAWAPAQRDDGRSAGAKARIEELERMVGRQQLDLDFFRKALRLADALQGQTPALGENNSTRSSKS